MDGTILTVSGMSGATGLLVDSAVKVTALLVLAAIARAEGAPDAAARAAGEALTVDEAVAEALRTPPPAAPPDPLAADVASGEGLTERERDVLRLLATGRSDQEIGDLLYISRRTVSTHVGSILAKLGLPSRAAASAYAARHGLD